MLRCMPSLKTAKDLFRPMSDLRQRRGAGRTSSDGAPISNAEDGSRPRHLDHDNFVDQQFLEEPREAPIGSIGLGLLLLLFGLVSLGFIAYDLWSAPEASESGEKKRDSSTTEDRFWPCVIIASLTLVPGVYVCFIALMARLGVRGWDYDAIR